MFIFVKRFACFVNYLYLGVFCRRFCVSSFGDRFCSHKTHYVSERKFEKYTRILAVNSVHAEDAKFMTAQHVGLQYSLFCFLSFQKARASRDKLYSRNLEAWTILYSRSAELLKLRVDSFLVVSTGSSRMPTASGVCEAAELSCRQCA